MSRPAGATASPPAVRKIAGPSPRMPVIPVTATSVSELSAAESWNMPELQTSPPASRNAFFRTAGFTRRAYAGGPLRRPPRRRAPDAGRTARRARRRRRGRRRRHGGRRTSSSRNGRAASISLRVGGRFDVAVPGCVGTTFQSRTSSSRPSSPSTRWTMVALASAGPEPVSWRSDVNAIPLTRAPRYPAASPTTRIGLARWSRAAASEISRAAHGRAVTTAVQEDAPSPGRATASG